MKSLIAGCALLVFGSMTALAQDTAPAGQGTGGTPTPAPAQDTPASQVPAQPGGTPGTAAPASEAGGMGMKTPMHRHKATSHHGKHRSHATKHSG